MYKRQVDDSLPPYQLTVYAKEYRSPDFLKGGVMYQIFPDRFYRSGRPKQDVPADRVLRDDWGGMPVWQPDAQGKIRNNDYFCGDLAGIEEKLPYLQELGVTCLYPVSYTHLDVYKRQGQGCVKAGKQIRAGAAACRPQGQQRTGTGAFYFHIHGLQPPFIPRGGTHSPG